MGMIVISVTFRPIQNRLHIHFKQRISVQIIYQSNLFRIVTRTSNIQCTVKYILYVTLLHFQCKIESPETT